MKKTGPQIFLFYGEEDFLIDEKLKELRAGGDWERLDGDDLSPETLATAICGGSLFGGDKLVVIRDFKVTADNQAALISLLANIPPGTRVVWQAPTADGRLKFFKWLAEHGEVAEFRGFAPWEQADRLRWVSTRARSLNKQISSDAARLLVEISGSSLRLLAGEIDKLVTYIGARPQITAEDVAALAAPGEANAFALLDALRAKDLKKALTLFQSLYRNGEDLFQLLGLIATQYRLMLQIKSLPGREHDPALLARKIKGSPYFIKKCLGGLERFSLAELKKSLSRLLEANLQLKTGEQQVVTYELLLAALCHV